MITTTIVSTPSSRCFCQLSLTTETHTLDANAQNGVELQLLMVQMWKV